MSSEKKGSGEERRNKMAQEFAVHVADALGSATADIIQALPQIFNAALAKAGDDQGEGALATALGGLADAVTAAAVKRTREAIRAAVRRMETLSPTERARLLLRMLAPTLLQVSEGGPEPPPEPTTDA